MERILEPELMEESAQVLAYAEADFDEPNSQFVSLFEQLIGDRDFNGTVLDLGCGPGDIPLRIAKEFPNCSVHGVDGSTTMLNSAKTVAKDLPDINTRVEFIHGYIPDIDLPRKRYDAVVSNSLLHHLPDPQALWLTVKSYAANSCPVLIMDLIRPESVNEAQALVQIYAVTEPEVLQRDFYNSLRAAFTLVEIEAQLIQADLMNLRVKQVSDRHVTVAGFLG